MTTRTNGDIMEKLIGLLKVISFLILAVLTAILIGIFIDNVDFPWIDDGSPQTSIPSSSSR